MVRLFIIYRCVFGSDISTPLYSPTWHQKLLFILHLVDATIEKKEKISPKRFNLSPRYANYRQIIVVERLKLSSKRNDSIERQKAFLIIKYKVFYRAYQRGYVLRQQVYIFLSCFEKKITLYCLEALKLLQSLVKEHF